MEESDFDSMDIDHLDRIFDEDLDACPCCGEKLEDYTNYPFCSYDCRRVYYE